MFKTKLFPHRQAHAQADEREVNAAPEQPDTTADRVPVAARRLRVILKATIQPGVGIAVDWFGVRIHESDSLWGEVFVDGWLVGVVRVVVSDIGLGWCFGTRDDTDCPLGTKATQTRIGFALRCTPSILEAWTVPVFCNVSVNI